MALDFTLSESQQVLQKNAREFAERVLEPIVEKIDRSADAWESFLAGREAYRQTAQAGFAKSFIPVFYGGAGLTVLDIAIAAEELSRADVNIPTTMLANGLALYPIIHYGTPEQKEHFLRPFADDAAGDLLAACAFTDVAGGANFDSPDPAGGIQTIAERDGDEWVITGEKHYTTNGTGWDKKGCQLYTVICRTDPAAAADDGGRAQELAIMAKVYCSEAATTAVYDCMRLVGIASYTKNLSPLERIMRDAMAFPLYDGGNLGMRRRQLHDMFRQPGYDSMLAAHGEVPPWET